MSNLPKPRWTEVNTWPNVALQLGLGVVHPGSKVVKCRRHNGKLYVTVNKTDKTYEADPATVFFYSNISSQNKLYVAASIEGVNLNNMNAGQLRRLAERHGISVTNGTTDAEKVSLLSVFGKEMFTPTPPKAKELLVPQDYHSFTEKEYDFTDEVPVVAEDSFEASKRRARGFADNVTNRPRKKYF